MLRLAIFCGVLFSLTSAQTCSDSGLGPCLMGSCPSGATCLDPSDPSGGTCCDNANIITATTTTTAATVATITTVTVPTTVPTGTTTAGATVTTTGTSTCVDLVNPNTGVSDCPSMASYCNNAAYYDLMTQQCPKTCNRCSSVTTTSSTSCVDLLNPNTGVSDCPKMASYCNNAVYYDLMTQQCPKTCGRCSASVTTTASSGTCVDLVNPNTGVSDCPKMASYCNNSAYYTLMTQQCPKTCNRCGASSATTASSTCVDKVNPTTGVSDCPSMASYCNNSAYYSLMTDQCPKTCGRCSG